MKGQQVSWHITCQCKSISEDEGPTSEQELQLHSDCGPSQARTGDTDNSLSGYLREVLPHALRELGPVQTIAIILVHCGMTAQLVAVVDSTHTHMSQMEAVLELALTGLLVIVC